MSGLTLPIAEDGSVTDAQLDAWMEFRRREKLLELEKLAALRSYQPPEPPSFESQQGLSSVVVSSKHLWQGLGRVYGWRVK